MKSRFLLLTGRWSRPDRTRPVVPTIRATINWSNATSVRSHATGRVQSQFHRSGTFLYLIGCYSPASSRSVASVRSRLLLPSLLIRASGHCATSVWSSVRSLLWACFFAILHMSWFLSLCLDFAWYLGSSLVLLRSCLWCWSSDHHFAFVQVTSCILLNNKIITCKFISLIWLCWSSNTKIQSKWVKGPFSLHQVVLIASDQKDWLILYSLSIDLAISMSVLFFLSIRHLIVECTSPRIDV